MKKVFIVLAFTLFSAVPVSSQNAAETAKPAKPISVLTWLVGGVWTADASKLGPGMRRIETRYQWSDNASYLRFNTHFITDKETLRRYDGNFFWNPDKSALAMWYMDAQNSITEGLVKVEGDVMSINFQGKGGDGKPQYYRVTVTRKTNDHYSWTLEAKQGDGWKSFPSLDYLRVTGN